MADPTSPGPAPPTTPPHQTAQDPPSDTPLSHKLSGVNTFKTRKHGREARFHAYATEMHGKFIGPLDNRVFLDTFFGEDAFHDHSVPSISWNDELKQKFVDVPQDIERAMYTPLMNAISSCVNESFEYIATHNYQDVSHLENASDSAPDGTLYDNSRCADRKAKSDSAFSDLLIEIKDGKQSTTFEDSEERTFEVGSERAVLLRGQLIAYAVTQFANQYRTHLFMVFIRGKTARLIRWDHAGALVTKAFRYDQEPYLAELCYRYTRATPEARGIDTSVERMPSDDKVAEEARQQLGLGSAEPIFKFQVWNDPPKLTAASNEVTNTKVEKTQDALEDEGYVSDYEAEDEDEEIEEIEEEKTSTGISYYGGKPFFAATHSVVGRATRVIKVWDPRREAVVMLKDCWRAVSDNILPEGQIYAMLKDKRVRHVPTCLRAGDVDPTSAMHRTLAQTYKPTRSHVHYRLIVKEVCRGNITQFKDTKELILVLCDGLIAHLDALEKCGLLHRDVSAGNLLITANGRGLLGDWELSKFVSDLGESRQPERTGTWQFISAALLQAILPFHKVEDDVESFFHVLGWTSLQYTKHEMNPQLLSHHLHNVYDGVHVDAGKVVGGRAKESSMSARHLGKAGFVPGPFRELIVDFEETCAARYLPEPDQDLVEIERQRLKEATNDADRKIFARATDMLVQNRKDRLKSVRWMIQRCKQALRSGDWSPEALARFEHDPPKYDSLLRPFGPSAQSSKRSSDVAVSQLEAETRTGLDVSGSRATQSSSSKAPKLDS